MSSFVVVSVSGLEYKDCLQFMLKLFGSFCSQKKKLVVKPFLIVPGNFA